MCSFNLCHDVEKLIFATNNRFIEFELLLSGWADFLENSLPESSLSTEEG